MEKEKSRMNPVVLDWNWKYRRELIVLFIERIREQEQPNSNEHT